jgi:hypothetical protein
MTAVFQDTPRLTARIPGAAIAGLASAAPQHEIIVVREFDWMTTLLLMSNITRAN